MQAFEGTSVNFLGYSAWLNLKKTALDALHTAIPEPTLNDFMHKRADKYPRELVIGGIVAMLLITLFAFIISAGKEWVVANEVFSSIPKQYGVWGAWQLFALIAVLLLGEIGALAFALASSLFGNQPMIRYLLRAASVTCAALALLGNLTLFFLDQHPGELVFEFVITVFPPLTVLAVGLVGERMLLEHLSSRETAINAYNRAVISRETALANAINNEIYITALQSLWAVQIVQYQPVDYRAKLKVLLSMDFTMRVQLFSHQFRMHEGRYPISMQIEGGATELNHPTQPPN